VLMSVVIYSGALEFAAVPLLCAAFNPVGFFLLGVTLSARHLFYGISMLKKYENTGVLKPFLIFGLTDETFSVLVSTEMPDGASPRAFYGFVTLFDYLYWNAGTLLGVVAGDILPFSFAGIDFSLTALFIVLLLEQMKTKTGRISSITGLCAAGLALAMFGKDLFVPISLGIILLGLVAGRRVIDRA